MSLFSQPYAAMKAREYLDKPAIHETMVKVRHPLFIVLILLFERNAARIKIYIYLHDEYLKMPILVIYTSIIYQ